MSEKPLGARQLDYATDIVNIFEPLIIDVTDQTEQEKHLKQRVIDAVNDCPKKKVGYLVMEIKDRERQGMTEKRFTIHKESKYKEEWYAYPFCIKEEGEVVLETIPLSIAEKVRDKLNEQQATIDEQKIIIEERDAANERLNRFLIEIGLEKEYIKWEFKKRCVE